MNIYPQERIDAVLSLLGILVRKPLLFKTRARVVGSGDEGQN